MKCTRTLRLGLGLGLGLVTSTVGCGALDPPSHQTIHYHHISKPEMVALFGQTANGRAEWRTDHNTNRCDIYLLEDLYWYHCNEDCYEAVRAHEEKHCAEGDWHSEDKPYVEEACMLPWVDANGEDLEPGCEDENDTLTDTEPAPDATTAD